ncbi:MAG: transcription termination/antitermination factor NusG [Candidatus Latescibacteria bacterium]|nr:transcription termination/antitermination factor NusG [Candidatus Latescibacterota bacterium]
MKYYVVHTYTKQEKKVKDILLKTIEQQNLSHLFGKKQNEDGSEEYNIIVPVEHITKFKKGKAAPEAEERKLYPGYLIVQMEANEESLNLVNSIPGVTHILGSKKQPLPLDEKEVEVIVEQIESGSKKLRPEIPFNKGEPVKVTNGPFMGFSGTVEEIYPDRRRIKVIVTIFGRATPIDLDFFEVQAI